MASGTFTHFWYLSHMIFMMISKRIVQLTAFCRMNEEIFHLSLLSDYKEPAVLHTLCWYMIFD